ncbi:hypothetical protein D9758_003192 [Tetrapyrgos nigripes]|uniref:Telomere length regulation protein conserved domain-containing protein n=1 Tax=Tetrapyrgos nigripes TaxID=182062 RepID=A0A8H5LQ78_9AGAR|nr:hypothetical protein D9758_003192 [Tetrapyrgos nigripes]
MDIRQCVHDLQQPITEFSTLLSLLSAPLDAIGLLQPQFRIHNVNPIQSFKVITHVSSIQKALIEHILPTWEAVLEENNSIGLSYQYFCPDLFSSATSAAGQVALLAYSTLTSLPLNKHSLYLLSRLSKEYPINRIHAVIFTGSDSVAKRNLDWEDCVQIVMSVPTKVANSIARNGEIPPSLEYKSYFDQIFVHCETLIWSLRSSREHISSIAHLINKLARHGMFSSNRPSSRSQPSFFEVALPIIKTRFTQEASRSYSNFWWQLVQELPSFVFQTVLRSFLVTLQPPDSVLDGSPQARSVVKKAATLSYNLCSLASDAQEAWDSVSAVILGHEWDEGYSRIFVCWLAACEANVHAVLSLLLDDVVSLWSSPDHIKHSLLARHRYVTSLLLITVSYLPTSDTVKLARSAQFIAGVGVYISHMDNSVRHCGMLTAEVIASRAGKELDFKDWEGDDSDKPWARSLRKLIEARDLDADVNLSEEVSTDKDITFDPLPNNVATESRRTVILTSPQNGYDSDDSITGYISPPSSRSTSPSPSELEEIERDPSLAVGVKKVVRPVYLAQLGAMIRSRGGLVNDNANEDANKIEMALNCAEELIRRKRDYGTELEENAVDLAYGLIALQDNYELEGFETKRQNALNALVACCPGKAAPCLIEEFFKNQYSTNQRYAILNALAIGARQLASLPEPASLASSTDVAFPSKRLPAPLHYKYTTSGSNILPQIMDGITKQVLDREREASVDKVPELVRERRLRIQQTGRISGVATGSSPVLPSRKASFNEVAAEFFIGPLINRFWLFLRDERTREERTAHYEGRGQYRGMGTGLILNPVVLSHLLRTLAILVHSSYTASEWSAVLAPESLELAVTIGTRPLSLGENDDGQNPGNDQTKEASVLSSAFELALIVLDGCIELDEGRSLSLDHTALLMGTGEWAGTVFAQLESGIKVSGGGGTQEASLFRAVSGVLLKVDEITSKWRRSMIDTW